MQCFNRSNDSVRLHSSCTDLQNSTQCTPSRDTSHERTTASRLPVAWRSSPACHSLSTGSRCGYLVASSRGVLRIVKQKIQSMSVATGACEYLCRVYPLIRYEDLYRTLLLSSTRMGSNVYVRAYNYVSTHLIGRFRYLTRINPNIYYTNRLQD